VGQRRLQAAPHAGRRVRTSPPPGPALPVTGAVVEDAQLPPPRHRVGDQRGQDGAGDRLALGVDVEWIQYSQMSSYDFSVGVNDHLMPSTSVPLNLQDSWNIAAGVEWEFAKNWKLRAGYRYEQTPVPDEYFTLSIPGADQHIGSIGVGYESENWRFAIAYAHSFFDTRKIRNNVVEAVNGDYDFFYNMLTLTLGYRF